jgi:hypothetical protein
MRLRIMVPSYAQGQLYLIPIYPTGVVLRQRHRQACTSGMLCWPHNRIELLVKSSYALELRWCKLRHDVPPYCVWSYISRRHKEKGVTRTATKVSVSSVGRLSTVYHRTVVTWPVRTTTVHVAFELLMGLVRLLCLGETVNRINLYIIFVAHPQVARLV